MKKRFLTFGILLAATGVALNFLSTPEATYTSIENRSKKTIEGIDVAQDYLTDRKANKLTGKVDLQDVRKAREQSKHAQSNAFFSICFGVGRNGS